MRATFCYLVGACLASSLLGCARHELIAPSQLNQSCSMPPAPVVFVLLGKNGQNLATKASDQLSISYQENGQTRLIAYTFGRLRNATGDTIGRYGGVGVGSELGSYSVRSSNAIKTFDIQLGSQTVGNLFYDLQKNTATQDCYRPIAFRFNNAPVRIDSTVLPHVALLHTNL